MSTRLKSKPAPVKERQFMIRISPSDLEEIRAAAAQEQRSIAQYFRFHALAAARSRKNP